MKDLDLDLRRADLERLYLEAFENPDGLGSLLAALATVGHDSSLNEKIYGLYLSHVRHVVASRRDAEYLRDLSGHLLRARDVLKERNLALSRRLAVLEDMVDDALATLPPPRNPARRREHVVSILRALASVPSMRRSDLRAHLRLGDANMSRLLRILEGEGLIARVQRGRVVNVAITPAGREELVQSEHTESSAPVVAVNLDADSSADALAQFALARFSLEALNKSGEDYAANFGLELGATIARYCEGFSKDGDAKFEKFWTLMLGHSLAAFDRASAPSDVCRGRFRLALMSILQRYARDAAEARVIAARRSTPDHERTILVSILGIREGRWRDALDTASQLACNLERSTLKPHVLTIGVSGYHEERIIAKLASDIFHRVNGYDGLQIASSPWAFDGVLDGLHEAFGAKAGRADIRLVNAAGVTNVDSTLLSEPLFRHMGYRAFANRNWLLSLTDLPDTPKAVRDWLIALETDGGADKATLFGSDWLSVRSWLTMKAAPVNYEQSEFAGMMNYILQKAGALATESGLTIPVPSSPDPDDVFEEFIRGTRPILISGSIHDILLEKFWIGRSGVFIRLLGKYDFRDWYDATDVGKNLVRFSDRLKEEVEIRALAVKLLSQVLRSVVQIVRSNDPYLRPWLLAYISTLLAPTHRENWNTKETDTRWSFAASEETVAALVLEEMQAEDNTPQGEGAQILPYQKKSA